MTNMEMQPSGSNSKIKIHDVSEHLNGYFRHLIGLGAGLLFCGIASLALGIANAIICGEFGSIGYGIWGALIYFATGAINIVSHTRQNRCMVGTSLIMSIVAAATAAVQIGLAVGATVADYYLYKMSGDVTLDIAVGSYAGGLDYFFVFGCSDAQRNSYWTWQSSGPTVTDALLASFGLLSGIFAVLAAIYSCRICICPPGVSLFVGHIEVGHHIHDRDVIIGEQRHDDVVTTTEWTVVTKMSNA